MIIRREMVNTIATYRYKGYTPATIAQLMNIAVADVKAAILAWRL